MLTAALLITAGLAALFQGGDALVLGAGRLARRFGVSPLVIGLTVVAFATSAPELAVSLIAAWEGTPALAVGNVLGSNIFNVLIAVGAVALITPIAVQPTLYRREIPFCLAVTLLALFFSWTGGGLGRLEGALLTLLLAGFLSMVVYQSLGAARVLADMDDEDDDEDVERDTGAAALVVIGAVGATAVGWDSEGAIRLLLALAAVATFGLAVFAEQRRGNLINLTAIGLGLLLLVLGSDALVDGCTTIAQAFGVSEAVIGLTVVAIGTSAPELATALVAARRGQDDIAVGNALGSNLFNLLAVLGLTALIKPIPVDPRFLGLDGWIAVGAVIILVPSAYLGARISRTMGAAFVGLWVIYTGWLIIQETARIQG
ncbi:MAG: calcium/sodium antiporter [Alphaproteobacteria bacterium]|nr:calcium/sodium antiporter [Alphaproteobacteria bacterium]